MKTYPVILLALLCVFSSVTPLSGQVPINSFSTSSTVVVAGGTLTQTIKSHAASVNTVLPSTNYTVKYNNNGNINIISFSYASKTYVKFSGFDTVMVKRASNTWEPTGGNKQHIYVQGNTTVDNVTYNMPFPAAFPVTSNYNYMQRVMEDGYINRGSDNVFNNDSTSDRTYNNIERVDFIYKNGIASSQLYTAGFLIAERGGNDPFKICAITGIDANGEPTSFGPVLTVGTSSYGSAITSITTYVMRKDVSDNTLRPFSIVGAQAIKAVFIRLGDLGVTTLQKIYGYTLMANDVAAVTSAQVLNYTNSTYFPRNTTTSDGGMDLAAAPGIFHTDLILAGQQLPLTIQNRNCQVQLQWSDESFATTTSYDIQRSDDGNHFVTIATVNAPALRNQFNDQPGHTVYYRIRANHVNSAEWYSPVVLSIDNCHAGTVSVFPNPATNMVMVNFPASAGIRKLSVITVTGKPINTWNVDANSSQVKMDITALAAGHYFVQLINATGVQQTFPFVKQ